MHGPLLSRAVVAGCEHQRCLVVGDATLDTHTLPTDANDGAVEYVPALTRTAITRDVQDRSTFSGSAALHVETKSTDADDVSIVEIPLLVPPRVALLDVHGSPRHRRPVVLDIH